MGDRVMKEDMPVRSRREDLGSGRYKSIEFYLSGEKGVVYLRFSKNSNKCSMSNLSYHAVREQHSGQESFPRCNYLMEKECNYLMEKECHYKEYSWSSEEFIELNARARYGDEERLWRYMEEIYENLI
jgi:hypothetical protein